MEGQRTGKETEGIERLLRAEAASAVPAPSGDLVGRTLARARAFILMRDLLRFLTLEGLWMRQDAGSRSADSARARQDR